MNTRLVCALAVTVGIACDQPTPPAPSEELPSASEGPPMRAAAAALEPLLDPEILAMVAPVELEPIAADLETLVGFQTRNTCSDNTGAAPGIGAARDWIGSQLAALPGLEVRLDPWTYTGCGGSSRTLHNVIAWIPGSGDPNRLIVLGGHYDSRTTGGTDGTNPAPGANDSGSQAALLLQVARLLAGHSFDATIVLGFWSGEEQLNLTFDIGGGDNTVNDLTALHQFRLFSPGTPREISSSDGTSDDTSPSRGLMRHIGY